MTAEESELDLFCADCAQSKTENPSDIVGDDLCASCRCKADSAESRD